MSSDTRPLLSIQDLRVDFHPGDGPRVAAVRGLSLEVAEDRIVALVGESGSGKSITALSIVNLLPPNARRQGRILWRGQDLTQATDRELQRLRGRDIACVFQDPMSSLNPVMTIGEQLMEPLQWHLGLSRREARERSLVLLAEVGIPEAERRLHSYPHQLSGGQQQRVMLAMALSCEPQLLIADEPTTALDVSVQRQILDLLLELKRQRRMSVLFISHDLSLVGELADEVVVMRQGVVREQGPVAAVFEHPQDEYTRALLRCRPRLEAPPRRLPVLDPDRFDAEGVLQKATLSLEPVPAQEPDPMAPVVLEAQALSKQYGGSKTPLWPWRQPSFTALQPTSFRLRRGHTLGVVGESGSGKSTLGLALLGLLDPRTGPQGGQVWLEGLPFLSLPEPQRRGLRKRIQIIFQNPYASLNPRFTVGQALLEPMEIHGLGASAIEREARARHLLRRVGLNEDDVHRYPHEFSGGQRQRIAIARSLTLSPEVLVLDEAVSALDVSVQAQVLNLLRDLQDDMGLTYVFISHDLAVVRFMADEVLVMQDGRVVEQGRTSELMSAPRQAYTQRLLAAIPRGYGGRATVQG